MRVSAPAAASTGAPGAAAAAASYDAHTDLCDASGYSERPSCLKNLIQAISENAQKSSRRNLAGCNLKSRRCRTNALRRSLKCADRKAKSRITSIH
ncbi:hypothetical protein QF001_000947 [Paraburkholderia youngii]|uniref:hypothetical protein n=1 Tax=Paraburkholderia youngii TaxID=2782701 RepID=UPI003D1AC18D